VTEAHGVARAHQLLGGIIAAGEGSRLRRDGFAAHKPLVEIAGVSLIERVLDNFHAAGVAPPLVIVNEDEQDCVERVRARFPERPIEFIVKTTASSLESFRLVTGAPRRGPMLVSTVDAWCRASDFAAFVDAAMRRPPDAVVLAVTPFVADEKPLWVDLEDDGRLSAIGSPRGAFVTAGMYVVPESVRRATPPSELGRLRELLGWLHESGHAMFGEVIPTVVDIDRADDVAIAEALERHAAIANSAGGRDR
jgi:NDP-sugar pyrophosphorylase family protein